MIQFRTLVELGLLVTFATAPSCASKSPLDDASTTTSDTDPDATAPDPLTMCALRDGACHSLVEGVACCNVSGERWRDDLGCFEPVPFGIVACGANRQEDVPHASPDGAGCSGTATPVCRMDPSWPDDGARYRLGGDPDAVVALVQCRGSMDLFSEPCEP